MQNRIISERERARFQGFLNNFIFPEDIPPRMVYRGIGNAVAVPVAQALGNELLTVLIYERWEKKKRSESPTIEERTVTEKEAFNVSGKGTQEDAIVLD